MTSSVVRSLVLAGLACCAAWPAMAQSVAHPGEAVRMAQFFEPDADLPIYDDFGGGRTETFIDEFGREVTVDGSGRIIAVEQPRRRRFEERVIVPDDRGPPADGLILEGPVDALLPPRSADPFYEGPIEAAPPRRGRAVEREAALPQDREVPEAVLPNTDARISIPSPAETTAPMSDPAPAIVGPTGKNAKVQIAALQVLLDRAGISPGVIDGRMGSNVDKAVAAYEEKFGSRLDATAAKALAEELDATGGPAIISYTITDKDAVGPYVASIPEDYGEKALLPAMSYIRVSEMLAERFHMDEAYLLEINPGADFNRAGTVVKVMAVGENLTDEVVKIVADKGREQVRAYDAAGRLVVAYPSTIGSSDTPSPSGTVQVSRIAFDPNYTYNPKINFTQGENKSILTIPPGPNGPVGSIWIALSKPTYGIHGTPEPSNIGKTNSHGCVRLTNFDAQELAKIVKAGVVVEFVE